MPINRSEVHTLIIYIGQLNKGGREIITLPPFISALLQLSIEMIDSLTEEMVAGVATEDAMITIGID